MVGVSADYFALAVAWAVENGVAEGYSVKYFRPEVFIPREQVVVMLHSYADYLGLVEEGAELELPFPDANMVSDWATESVSWAASTGMMTGKQGGYLQAHATATRGEVVTMLSHFVDFIECNFLEGDSLLTTPFQFVILKWVDIKNYLLGTSKKPEWMNLPKILFSDLFKFFLNPWWIQGKF